MLEGPIVRKSFAFSIEIINYYRVLVSKKEYDIARQLLKSGTSIGANVFEAQYAESKLDFIHKMKIASKEANETFYWLSLCEKIPDFEIRPNLIKDVNEILAILSGIINYLQEKSEMKLHYHSTTLPN